jgi:hypothetical protein
MVYLCWQLGEESIQYWHDIESGFAGREPLDEDRPVIQMLTTSERILISGMECLTSVGSPKGDGKSSSTLISIVEFPPTAVLRPIGLY